MTHGPPRYILDRTERDDAVGCEHLLRAVCRARPLLHCFGHVHTNWAAERVTWDTSAKLKAGKEDASLPGRVRVGVLQNTSRRLGKAIVTPEHMIQGEHTLFVNAAIEDKEWTNAPWLVTLDLPVKGQGNDSKEQCAGESMKVESATSSSSSLKRKSAEEKGGEVSTSVAKKGKYF